MLYILRKSYVPNTAATNRALAFIRSFSLLGIHAKVVFFLPDTKFSKISENFPNVEIDYLWENGISTNKFLKYFSYHLYVNSFIKKLKRDDIVLVLGMTDVIGRFVNKKGIKVYAEMTEHPDVVQVGSPVNIFTKFTLAKAYSKINGLFVISSSLKNYFIRKGVPEKNIHIINMVVDPSRFTKLEINSNCQPYVAYCGTASNNKDGVDDLITSFSFVAPKYPNLKLLIIGNMPSDRERCSNMELISNLGLKDKVIITGQVASEDVLNMLFNAKILLLARPDNLQARNGFPTKLGEYLLTKKPVLVTKVGDIPLFLKDNESAFIAEPNNPKMFAEKMIDILEHYADAQKVGDNGYNVAIKVFNAMNETKKIVNIINN